MTNGDAGGEPIVGFWPPEDEVEKYFEAEQSRDFGLASDHMGNFNRAIDDALSRWELDGDRPAKVALRVRVRRVNPGWIIQYQADLTPGT